MVLNVGKLPAEDKYGILDYAKIIIFLGVLAGIGYIWYWYGSHVIAALIDAWNYQDPVKGYYNPNDQTNSGAMRLWSNIAWIASAVILLAVEFKSHRPRKPKPKPKKRGKKAEEEPEEEPEKEKICDEKGIFVAAVPVGKDSEYRIFVPMVGHLFMVPIQIKVFAFPKFPLLLQVVEKPMETITNTFRFQVVSKDSESVHDVEVTYTGLPDRRNTKALLRSLTTLNKEAIKAGIESEITSSMENAFSKWGKARWIGPDKNFLAAYGFLCEATGLANSGNATFLPRLETVARRCQQRIRLAFREEVFMVRKLAFKVKMELDDQEMAQLPANEDFKNQALERRTNKFRELARQLVADSIAAGDEPPLTYTEAYNMLQKQEKNIEGIDVTGNSGALDRAGRANQATGRMNKSRRNP